MSHRTQWIGLAAWVLVSFAPGWIGARWTPGAWYAGLVKPALTPPGVVFPVVWTTLYALMGVAAWLVWRRAGFAGAAWPLGLVLAQLVLNGLWSWLFFGAQRPGAAFVEVVVLWLLILATTVGFWRRLPAAGALLVPYLVWVGFASWLNLRIWTLNR